ncbi:cbb3-type cytochrome oxidase assembly protein CcoS [Maritimibacter sp. 55A14]|uniref:cbb3-type cytochrome oxidase assembly protein CcoS n=1 Tax=Maritimibacter sp. 55A14 TaxID=2174844 RepID=UPI000D610215|nr:cbb3-type cytochrome oxidase assembly protein CcoS [Maritimibacter sp. 55A14]PWE32262.1 cbb3-type cytochrome oxidase assembly protein CcoS [Maritimibacter sp. 55A14]
MDILSYLIPISLLLGGAGLAAFFWALRTRQFDDPDGDAQRILRTDYDDAPKQD